MIVTLNISPLICQKTDGDIYDSFWDRYGVVVEQAIIAKSFTELLERIYVCKGQQWYWLQEDFISYGDAYDAI